MKKVIAFDLDDTLAVTKSAISDRMAQLLAELLETHDICVISGGNFDQFKKQVIDNIKAPHHLLTKMHMMPTCGTRYYRFDDIYLQWRKIYSEDIPDKDKQRITEVLVSAANEAGYCETKPDGEIV